MKKVTFFASQNIYKCYDVHMQQTTKGGLVVTVVVVVVVVVLTENLIRYGQFLEQGRKYHHTT